MKARALPTEHLRRYAPNVAWFSSTALLAFGLAHHEMWRDELQAWSIARSSSSLGELFRNLEYEGHPPLYYVLLWALARVVSTPVMVQWFNFAVVAAANALWVRNERLPIEARLLVPLSSIPLTVWGLVSRSYSLVYLAFAIYFVVLARLRRPIAGATACSIVMCLTAVYAVPLAGAMLIAAWLTLRVSHRSIATSGSAAVAAALSSLWLSRPRPDGIFPDAPWPGFADVLASLGRAIEQVVLVQHAVERSEGVSTLIGAGFLAGIGCVALRRPAVAVVAGAAMPAIIVMAAVAGGPIGIRHTGIGWLGIVGAYTLVPQPRRWVRVSAVAVLSLAVVLGLDTFRSELRTEYSSAPVTARAIRVAGTPDLVVCDTDIICPSVAVWLGVPAAAPQRDFVFEFSRWKACPPSIHYCIRASEADVITTARRHEADGKTVAIVLSVEPEPGSCLERAQPPPSRPPVVEFTVYVRVKQGC